MAIDPAIAALRARLIQRARTRALAVQIVIGATQTFLVLFAATLAFARVSGIWH